MFGHSAPLVSPETSDNNIHGLSRTHIQTHARPDSEAKVFLALVKNRNKCLSFPRVSRPCGALHTEKEAKMAVDTSRQQTLCSDADALSLVLL